MKPDNRVTEVIAFCSGKGGTGKTSLIAALGYALRYCGHSVLMIDADRATDGFSLFLLGPDGTKQMDSFGQGSTFVGLLNTFEQTSQMVPTPHIVHRIGTDDHQLSYEVIISGKGLYGDSAAEPSGIPVEPWNLQFDRSIFQAGVRALFDAVRQSGQYDYVLVDSRGGFSFESTDVAAAADSFVVVTEATMTNFYQDRNLVNRINDAATNMGVRSLLRGIIVNKSTEFPEVSFRNELVREFGVRSEDTFPVRLDVEAAAAYKTQKAIYISAPASAFAYDSLQAFKQILRVVTSQWAEDRVLRWNQLVVSIDSAIAAHNAQVELQRTREEEKAAALSALTAEREQLVTETRKLREASEQEKKRQDILFEELKAQTKRRDEQFEQERAEAKARFAEERGRQDRLIEQLEVRLREASNQISQIRETAQGKELRALNLEKELTERQHQLEADSKVAASEGRLRLIKAVVFSALIAAAAAALISFEIIEYFVLKSSPNANQPPTPAAGATPPTLMGEAPTLNAVHQPPGSADSNATPPDAATDVVTHSSNLPAPRKWFKQCLKGTKNVIVASGIYDRDSANKMYALMKKVLPNFELEVVDTVAPDQVHNRQYAIVAGYGLTGAEATVLIKELNDTGTLPYGVYSKTQSQDAVCVGDGAAADASKSLSKDSITHN